MDAPTTTTVANLALGDIAPENNDRGHFADGALQELATSILAHGLAQPITVRPRTDGAFGWWIVAGERRWRAHQLAGLDTIRAIVVDATDEEAAAIMLLENVNRVDLNPMEEAAAYQSRMDRFGYTVEALAAQTGKTAGVIKARLQLLTLAPRVQAVIAAGGFFLAGAAQIAGLDHNRQILAVNIFARDPKMSGATWDALVSKLRTEQQADDQYGLLDCDDFLVIEEFHLGARAAARPSATKVARLLAAALATVPADHPDRTDMLTALNAYGLDAQ